MDNITDVLLLRAVQGWCDECEAEQVLMPVLDEAPGGFCCAACDTAVFAGLDDLAAVAALRMSA
ncbi:MAG TPA: hypothetical protein VGN19_00430 [Pedococcus sp.]|jgi:hypothetical protein|nr:hypothetical protein [Pedococcus sp.]